MVSPAAPSKLCSLLLRRLRSAVARGSCWRAICNNRVSAAPVRFPDTVVRVPLARPPLPCWLFLGSALAGCELRPPRGQRVLAVHGLPGDGGTTRPAPSGVWTMRVTLAGRRRDTTLPSHSSRDLAQKGGREETLCGLLWLVTRRTAEGRKATDRMMVCLFSSPRLGQMWGDGGGNPLICVCAKSTAPSPRSS